MKGGDENCFDWKPLTTWGWWEWVLTLPILGWITIPLTVIDWIQDVCDVYVPQPLQCREYAGGQLGQDGGENVLDNKTKGEKNES